MDGSRCAWSASVHGPLCPQCRDTSILLHRLAEAFILDGGLWCRGGSGAACATAVAWACVRHTSELGAELGEGSVRQSHPSRHQDGSKLGCGKLQGEHSATNTHTHICVDTECLEHQPSLPNHASTCMSVECSVQRVRKPRAHTKQYAGLRVDKGVYPPTVHTPCFSHRCRHPPDWCPGHRRP